jgi:hypothetical protein
VLRSGLLVESGINQHDQDSFERAGKRVSCILPAKPRYEGIGDTVFVVSEDDGSKLV